MQILYSNQLSKNQLVKLCARPSVDLTTVANVVRPIISAVKNCGDSAIKEYSERFDKAILKTTVVSEKEISAGVKLVPKYLKTALRLAAKNITKFHIAQKTSANKINTMPGVACWREARGIEKVGLYIPGGTAPLPSTVLMLGIPARLAGCKKIVLCTPPQTDGKINASILFASSLCGITKIFKIGGAQAIAAMAYGTKTVPKVYKIFGPGNQYVTAAKQLVSIDPNGAAIDMPAGPSEVLVIADEKARADFVAADLLSQAEHGPDSQAVLVCTSQNKTKEILSEVKKQLNSLPRKSIAEKSLSKSFALVVRDINEAIEFSNAYAPEHLIINITRPEKYLKNITNAGSVFIGPYSPESAGDYASGTNHTLPTSGYARSCSGVSLESFCKNITFQKLSQAGAKKLGPAVARIAKAESLEAHARAMKIRYIWKILLYHKSKPWAPTARH